MSSWTIIVPIYFWRLPPHFCLYFTHYPTFWPHLPFYPNFSQNVYACFISSLMDPLTFCHATSPGGGRPVCIFPLQSVNPQFCRNFKRKFSLGNFQFFLAQPGFIFISQSNAAYAVLCFCCFMHIQICILWFSRYWIKGRYFVLRYWINNQNVMDGPKQALGTCIFARMSRSQSNFSSSLDFYQQNVG